MQIPLSEVQFIFSEPLALLLPLLALLAFLARDKSGRQCLPFPSLRAFQSTEASFRQRIRTPILASLVVLAILSMGLAAARPQILLRSDPQSFARSIILVLDVSKSMSTRDISTPDGLSSRIDSVKQTAKDFISSRKADRIGLVLFGTDVFLKTPLTLHHQALFHAIDEITIGSAGQLTAIGDAVAQALKRVKGIPAGARAVILFTDGMNTTGGVDPLRAAAVAARLGVRVHTIGIGSSTQRTRAFEPSEEKSSEFDEYMLKKIAAITGGVYSNAASSMELEKIRGEIDKIERFSGSTPPRPVLYELFLPLAVIAASSFCLLLLLSESFFRKLP